MGLLVSGKDKKALFKKLSETYDIYAPKRFPKEGRFSDLDLVKYAKIESFDEIEFNKKSDYPMKEVITPIQRAILYFTEDEYRESKGPKRPILVFCRPCDINANVVQDRIYAQNVFSDLYYTRVRKLVKFVLMDCHGGDDTCFCVSMKSNKTDNYSLACKDNPDGSLSFEVKDKDFDSFFKGYKANEFKPEFVKSNELKLTVPEIKDKKVLNKLKEHPFWHEEFDKRCISCGACTIACSTCTCFTTKDIIYGDNPEVGERRRISASCQIDGFTTVAGGASYRKTPGDKMRYKVLHKFHDYKARFKESHMCVGCGRCIHRCPEFISIVTTVEKMSKAIKEIEGGKKK